MMGVRGPRSLLTLACFGLAALAGGCAGGTAVDGSGSGAGGATASGREADADLKRAYEEHDSNLQVEDEGTVLRILSDDSEGDRHQRFIVRLASGQTLLVAHNIDLAPRIPDLREGDTVAFKGEYEWSEQGGTIHWTHRDPDGDHAAGWLWHDGQRYE